MLVASRLETCVPRSAMSEGSQRSGLPSPSHVDPDDLAGSHLVCLELGSEPGRLHEQASFVHPENLIDVRPHAEGDGLVYLHRREVDDGERGVVALPLREGQVRAARRDGKAVVFRQGRVFVDGGAAATNNGAASIAARIAKRLIRMVSPSLCCWSYGAGVGDPPPPAAGPQQAFAVRDYVGLLADAEAAEDFSQQLVAGQVAHHFAQAAAAPRAVPRRPAPDRRGPGALRASVQMRRRAAQCFHVARARGERAAGHLRRPGRASPGDRAALQGRRPWRRRRQGLRRLRPDRLPPTPALRRRSILFNTTVTGTPSGSDAGSAARLAASGSASASTTNST